jgi:adenylosuccinate synthase
VTKRPRRCGWLYLPDLRFSALINGIDRWNITKLDVLDTEEIIPVGVGEKSDGSVQYEELPGWKTSTANIASFDALPKEARDFIAFIEEKTDIPVAWIGTGQAREAMIMRG